MHIIILKDDKIIRIDDHIEAILVIDDGKLIGHHSNKDIPIRSMTSEIYDVYNGTVLTHGSVDSDIEWICSGVDRLEEVLAKDSYNTYKRQVWDLANKIDERFGVQGKQIYEENK